MSVAGAVAAVIVISRIALVAMLAIDRRTRSRPVASFLEIRRRGSGAA